MIRFDPARGGKSAILREALEDTLTAFPDAVAEVREPAICVWTSRQYTAPPTARPLREVLDERYGERTP